RGRAAADLAPSRGAAVPGDRQPGGAYARDAWRLVARCAQLSRGDGVLPRRARGRGACGLHADAARGLPPGDLAVKILRGFQEPPGASRVSALPNDENPSVMR